MKIEDVYKGMIVRIKAMVVFEYEIANVERILTRKNMNRIVFKNSANAIVLGRSKKATGYYLPGKTAGSSPDGYYEAEAPTLQIEDWTKVVVVELIEDHKSYLKPIYVLPEDVELISDPWRRE